MGGNLNEFVSIVEKNLCQKEHIIENVKNVNETRNKILMIIICLGSILLIKRNKSKMTIQEYEELEKIRKKEIHKILKQACKLLEDSLFLDKLEQTEFLALKHEACIEDLKSIPVILAELKRVYNKVIGEIVYA